MQLIVSKLAEEYHGLSVALKHDDSISTVALINGNKEDVNCPVVLFSIDQEVVYGLSHRKVVRRIYDNGPQILITSKELGHKLFEHGMKAALGKIKIHNTPFSTTLDTFYNLKTSYSFLSLEQANGRLGISFEVPMYKKVLIANSAFKPKEEMSFGGRIDIDKIQSQVTYPLESLRL